MVMNYTKILLLSGQLERFHRYGDVHVVVCKHLTKFIMKCKHFR